MQPLRAHDYVTEAFVIVCAQSLSPVSRLGIRAVTRTSALDSSCVLSDSQKATAALLLVGL